MCRRRRSQLIYNGLMTFDEQLRVVPDLAERLDNPEPTEYVVTLRRGVRFHDGHELTSADVVYTFRSLLEPDFVTPHKGAFRAARVDRRARSLHGGLQAEGAVRFVSVNLVLPQIVPDGASRSLREHPVGTGPTGSSDTPSTIISSWPRSTVTSAAARATTASC